MRNLSGTHAWRMLPPRRCRPQRRHRGIGVPGRRGEAGGQGGSGASSRIPTSRRRLQDPPRLASSPRVRPRPRWRRPRLPRRARGRGGRRGRTPRADWPEVSGPHPRAVRSSNPEAGEPSRSGRARCTGCGRRLLFWPLGFDSELVLPVGGLRSGRKTKWS